MDTSINRIAEALPDVLSKFSILPTVAAEDDGKVLTVVDGAWDKAEASGMLVVTVTNGETAGTYTADTSAADIYAAYKAGRTVVAVLGSSSPGYESVTFYNLLSATKSMASYTIHFGCLSCDGNGLGARGYEIIFNNDSISIAENKFLDKDQIIGLVSTLIAPEYRDDQTYSKGDFVFMSTNIGDGIALYECLQDIATPEPFSYFHWNSVNVATILKRIPVA